MTATTAPKVKDQDVMPLEFIESPSVNSFVDLVPSSLDKTHDNDEKKQDDFVNIFICHLIFYAVFCISLVLHILFDLRLAPFAKKRFLKLIKIEKNNVVQKNPAFV